MNLQIVLLFIGYVALLLCCILGMHFGIIDSQAGSLIIGGVLSHLGFSGLPSIAQEEKKTA